MNENDWSYQMEPSNAVQFMIEGLKDLDNQLDGKLNLFHGDYMEVIEYLVNEMKIESIFTNTEYTPYAKQRDKNIYKYCKKNKLEFGMHHDISLFPPGKDLYMISIRIVESNQSAERFNYEKRRKTFPNVYTLF